MNSFDVASKIIAGGIAGASETIITFPAEFAKTRRQLHFQRLDDLDRASSPGSPKRPPPPSAVAIVRSALRAEGLRGLYTGCAALAASNAAKSGIRFLAFETTRARLDRLAQSRAGGGRAPWINVVAGASAGVAESVLVVTPGEAVKTRMIHEAATRGGRSGAGSGNRHLLSYVAALVRDEGVRALWKGVTPVVCKQGTNSAVRFTTYAMLQERVVRRWPALDGSAASALVLGGISGVFTVYASMPFDNIKTRMQSSHSQYRNMLDCARQTLRADGVWAFWRGTSPRLVRLTLSSGITFTVYEQVITALKLARTSISERDDLAARLA